MHQLNRNKPFAEVHGLPGAIYEQEGMYFNGNGDESSLRSIEEETSIISEEIIPPNPLSASEIMAPESDSGLGEMHWKHLKALVESYGGEWENKEKALIFLKGKTA